jgi:hypothetical protein
VKVAEKDYGRKYQMKRGEYESIKKDSGKNNRRWS